MRYLKYFALFFIPFVLVSVSVILYFKVSGKLSNYTFPELPEFSIQNVIKFSRYSLEKAPSESLVGVVTEMNGLVRYESREATTSAEIKDPPNIQQGDKLLTGENANLLLQFKNVAEIKMDPNSVIGIIQTLPPSLIFSQSAGDIFYKKLSNDHLSVRAMHLLVETDGEVKIVVDKANSIVKVVAIKGVPKIAYNNLNFDTRLFNLEEGKTLIFDDVSRSVVIENN